MNLLIKEKNIQGVLKMIRANVFELPSEVMEFLNKNNITKDEFWQLAWDGEKQFVVLWERGDGEVIGD